MRQFNHGCPQQRSIEQLESRELLAGDLVAHWQADDLRTQLSDGQTVEAWIDRVSGIAADAEGTPLLAANQIRGRALITLDASDGDDWLEDSRSLSTAECR